MSRGWGRRNGSDWLRYRFSCWKFITRQRDFLYNIMNGLNVTKLLYDQIIKIVKLCVMCILPQKIRTWWCVLPQNPMATRPDAGDSSCILGQPRIAVWLSTPPTKLAHLGQWLAEPALPPNCRTERSHDFIVFLAYSTTGASALFVSSDPTGSKTQANPESLVTWDAASDAGNSQCTTTNLALYMQCIQRVETAATRYSSHTGTAGCLGLSLPERGSGCCSFSIPYFRLETATLLHSCPADRNKEIL